MPRDINGDYTLPLPPVITGETIEALWANGSFDDFKSTFTDSLSRAGNGAMQAQLKHVDGSKSAPGLSFVSESNTGFYRAGPGDLYVSVLGVDYMRWTDDNGVQISLDGATWLTVANTDQIDDLQALIDTNITDIAQNTSDIAALDVRVTAIEVADPLYVQSLAIEGPVNQLSSDAGNSGTMTIDTSIANRFRAECNSAINLTITKPTGPAVMSSGPVEEYTVEGTVLFTNTPTASLITLVGVPAVSVLGTNSQISGAKYLLSYVIHRLTGDVYDEIYIWSALP